MEGSLIRNSTRRPRQTFGWILAPLALGLASCGDVAAVGPSELGVLTEMLEPSDIVGALDGRLMQFPCATSPQYPTDDCPGLGYVVNGVVTACSAGKSEMILDHPIGGTPGARYAMTMHLYGIMEPKHFGSAAVREAAPGAPQRNGGTPTPWAQGIAGGIIPPSSYSAYEIYVLDQNGLPITTPYYLNADTGNGHWTLRIDYVKTIEVVGGGFVRLRRLDPNCFLIKNCGTTPGYPCSSKARTIDLSLANPPPPAGAFPAGLVQPGLNLNSNNGGQWWFIDVTAVQAL